MGQLVGESGRGEHEFASRKAGHSRGYTGLLPGVLAVTGGTLFSFISSR